MKPQNKPQLIHPDQRTMGHFYPLPSNRAYGVSSDSRVINFKTNRILKPYASTYIGYSLSEDGQKTYRTAHSLVAETFLGLVRGGKDVVDHNNGDKHDNRADNLTVTDKGFNARNRTRKDMVSRYTGVTKNNGNWIAQTTVDGKQIVICRGLSEIESSRAYWNFRQSLVLRNKMNRVINSSKNNKQ